LDPGRYNGLADPQRGHEPAPHPAPRIAGAAVAWAATIGPKQRGRTGAGEALLGSVRSAGRLRGRPGGDGLLRRHRLVVRLSLGMTLPTFVLFGLLATGAYALFLARARISWSWVSFGARSGRAEPIPTWGPARARNAGLTKVTRHLAGEPGRCHARLVHRFAAEGRMPALGSLMADGPSPRCARRSRSTARLPGPRSRPA